MHKLITKTLKVNGYEIICTQEWIESLKGGHYKGIILNKDKHIVDVFKSCGGVPETKLDDVFLINKYEDAKRWNRL